MVKTYVRKPEPIQAIQWTGDNLEEIRSFIGYEKRNPKACDSTLFELFVSYGRANREGGMTDES